MATTSTFIAVEPAFTEPERLALAGFLAGYTGLTREAYASRALVPGGSRS